MKKVKMLSSIPVPWQALLWPLIGAAIVLGMGRTGPNWLRRLVASAAALASLVALLAAGGLWSGGQGPVEPVEIPWSPVNLFRLSPLLSAGGLGLLGSLAAAAVTAASALGIRGTRPHRTTWHGLLLIVFAGVLGVAMAANLLTIALGSGLIDLALIAMAASAPAGTDHPGRAAWWLAVSGVLSTLLLFSAALRMDAQIGTASLLARQVPPDVLLLAGVAGLLRLTVFPLHPHGSTAPQKAATLTLVALSGTFLLARVQTLPGGLDDQPWNLILASVALLAGGLMAWSARLRSSGTEDRTLSGGDGALWLGLWVNQAGFALAYIVVIGSRGVRPAPFLWPLLATPAALSLLAIWWDGALEGRAGTRAAWALRLETRLKAAMGRGLDNLATSLPFLDRLRSSRLPRHIAPIAPAIALGSLVGLPFTAGAHARWSLYANLLAQGRAAPLFVILAADTLLTAGLWTAFAALFSQARLRVSNPLTLLAAAALAALLLATGLLPGALPRALGLQAPTPVRVSKWGLGLVYALPWLLGGWLARARPASRVEKTEALVQRALRLEWIDRPAAWAEERLAGAVYWLGQVGEGEGWWGWALIILALGTLFLTTR